MNIKETLSFIKKAHKGQKDKSGKPYWKHPVAVMKILGEDSTFYEKQVALLHDVVEDTDWTVEDLTNCGFTKDVVDAVDLVSRDPNSRLTYFEWIKEIAKSKNKIAIKVKYADLVHNSLPWRIADLPPKQKGILDRYVRAKAFLEHEHLWD